MSVTTDADRLVNEHRNIQRALGADLQNDDGDARDKYNRLGRALERINREQERIEHNEGAGRTYLIKILMGAAVAAAGAMGTAAVYALHLAGPVK